MQQRRPDRRPDRAARRARPPAARRCSSTATWKHRFSEPVRFSSSASSERAEEQSARCRRTCQSSPPAPASNTTHVAAAVPIAATPKPILASKRSALSTGIAHASTVNGGISCDSAPQNAIATGGAPRTLCQPDGNCTMHGHARRARHAARTSLRQLSADRCTATAPGNARASRRRRAGAGSATSFR